MVYCEGRWRFCRGLVVDGAGVVGRLSCGSGMFAGVMERIRWCRPCGWGSALVRGGAIDDVSNRSAICEDGVILLWREMPAAEG